MTWSEQDKAILENLTPLQKRILWEKHNNPLDTQKEIGDRLGCSDVSVSKTMSKYGYFIQGRNFHKSDPEWCPREYLEKQFS